MKHIKAPHPPRWATRLLGWYCRPALLEDLEGDLNECFDRHVRLKGPGRARLIYVIDVLKFCRFYTLKRPRYINLLIQWIMIGSYFKTARRTMVRNKLFSFINIAGLAVSMSVGLLMIAFVSDLRSYDSFHKKKDRIYRVTTTDNHGGGHSMKLASTSVRAGKQIAASVTGVEVLTFMRRGFGGDVTIGNAVIPVWGLWADQNFFEIFSFSLLQGNPATALKEPFSVVLTEKAAHRLFGQSNVLGKAVQFGADDYVVTGVMKDVPTLSHLNFEVLGAFATLELQRPATDGDFLSWSSIYMDYIYLMLAEHSEPVAVQAGLDKLCAAENADMKDRSITLNLQPLKAISINTHLENEIGPVMNVAAIWVLSGLALVVILSACFNYTNLSIARALRRSREVGIRKIVGAYKRQVLMQFITEAVIVALLALGFSFVIFLFLRDQFMSLNPSMGRLVLLELSPRVVVYFAALAIGTGIAAGLLPAVVFSRIQAIQALKDVSSVRLFRHVTLRKTLIVVQYVFSLVFITATIIGHNQYKSFLVFDLGFNTENILNINLQGNKGDVLAHELSALPAVAGVSQSLMITSLGSNYGGQIKYANDSAGVSMNFVDDGYLSVHGHKLVAGRNFNWKPDSTGENEIIVNEKLLKRFDIAKGDPQKALGETVMLDNRKLTIVGVLKDFHYETVLKEIGPTVFRYNPGGGYSYVNVKLVTSNLPAAIAGIEAAWKKVDKAHPLDARFYNDQIEEAYNQFSVMVKVIGFLAFLAICIASLGLFGMVVFTTETKLREISIRKVLGASEGGLVVQLSRGFLVLLLIASAIALPLTYLFFDRVVLAKFAYHAPIHWAEMISGVAGVMTIAFLMIGSQTLKVARTNPASTLKQE